MRFRALLTLLAPLLASSLFASDRVDYLRDVKPILKRHCIECHGQKKQRGELRLDSAKAILKGGENGAVVVPGHSAKSLLIKTVRGESGVPKMPRNRTPLTQAEITVLAKWIDQGAAVPQNEQVARHWAFVPPQRPPLPGVKDRSWPNNAIDYFVLARLEEKGLSPSPEADRITLLRRVYLDLIGLPPSPEEVDAFLADTRPGAYERVVDRLLSSPHYGEKWARHWLDVARYADSNGFTIDSPREIWLYRDWVIRAFNQDMPFDQFVIEQYAGDLLPNADDWQKIATGFHRNTLINQEGGVDREQFRVEAVADRVLTTGVVFLGLTLGCARCHDHKYDPISQEEYFRLFAFLNNQSEPTMALATPALIKKREAIEQEIEKIENAINGPLQDFVKKLPKAEQDRIKDNISMILRLRPDQRTESQKQQLRKYFSKKDAKLKKQFDRIEALKKKMPKFPTTMVLRELPKPRITHVHIKGDFTRKGKKVEPGVPSVLHPLPPRPADGKRYTRLDLAKWLVDRNNPLTARVTVNRIWQRYFGKGIVATENDFGTQGTPPTHPKLLDWLAVEFMESGWKLKHLHKLIVTSATYRQASKVRPDLAKVDPHNRLLGRQNRYRLDAELIRDSALAASGLLSRKIGGPSVRPPQPKGVYAFTQVKRQWQTSTGDDRYRRGLYTFFQRSAPYPMLKTFDAPDANSSCTRRVRSNTPLQALTLLNDQAMMEIAYGLATRVLREGPPSESGRIDYAFRLCLVRSPDAGESQSLESFLRDRYEQYRRAPKQAEALLRYCGARAGADAARRAAWVAVARVLLNLDEFMSRE